ncbi:monocarboxylate permease [Rhizoctonia solani AG-1 IA]|uniref:Monocarboxylate permease n=1 Tax=Thanatephorus cucumeris (strain AG1-IA) TaxID=983506 RepID=L8X4Z2_THACA|nr:monocarboxylate permease [Rhizoctonia solani AG-1 IA]
MTTSLVPSSRPISLGTTGDDIDGKTIAESDTGKRESGLDPDQEKPEHHRLANIDAAPDREELKKEGIAQGEDEFPDGGLRAWLVVLGGACVTFGTFGFVNAWGLTIKRLFFPTPRHPQCMYTGVLIMLPPANNPTRAWIGSVQYALVFLPGLLTGRLFDLGHYRVPQIFAAALLIIGTFLAAECHEYWQFLLCQGIAVGVSRLCLSFVDPSMTQDLQLTASAVRARRGLALGILASGSSIGGTVIPIAVRKLIPIVGFKWAMRIIGFILLFVLTVAILTLRRRLPPKKVSGGLLNLKAFLHIPYSIYVLASVVSFLGLYTGEHRSHHTNQRADKFLVLTYLEVYATEIGLPEDFAFYMIPIANAASLFGRVGSGVVSDRIGPINTLIPSTLVAGVCTYAWPFARNKGSLIVLACIYGAACGVFVGMLATPVAKMGSMDDVGRRTGMLMSVIAAGAVAGPPISGAIRDKTGSFIQVGYYADFTISVIGTRSIMKCSYFTFFYAYIMQLAFLLSNVLRNRWPYDGDSRDQIPRGIVDNDLYLQYILQLEKSGYVIPKVTREDLSYSDMIQALQNHQKKWQRIELGEPKFIEFPDPHDTVTYFADNLYAYYHRTGRESDGSSCCTLRLYLLPSLNTGIEFRHWHYDILDTFVRAFATQPRIDLLVLLESCPYPDDRGRFVRCYRIHLRSLSTNQPHPYAIDATPLLNLGLLEHYFLTRRPPIHIYGRMLSFIFRPNFEHPEGEPLIIVFDWVIGVEVGRYYLPAYTEYSISFISEEYFIIPQGYRSIETNQSNPTGRIDLYYSPICDDGTRIREVKHVASLAFPSLHKDQSGLSLQVHCVPSVVPKTPYWFTRLGNIPKTYEQNSSDHLCLYYEASTEKETLHSSYQSELRFSKDLGTSGLLFIPFQGLLSLFNRDYCNHRSNSEGPALIPWEVWGSCTICLPDTELPDIILHGGKYLFLRGSSAPHSPDDSLFPISVLELKFRQLSQAKVPNSSNWVCTSKSNQDTTSREPSYAYTIDCRTPVQESHELGILGEALPDIRAYCKKTTVNVDEETKCNINDYDVMANDEHCRLLSIDM